MTFQKENLFDFQSIHEASTFHLANLLQIPNNHRMVDMSSSAISHVALRASASKMALKWSLSTFNGWLLCSSSSRLLPLLQNFLNYHCTVRLLAVPRPDALLMVQVVATALRPILNKKLLEFAFCLISFP